MLSHQKLKVYGKSLTVVASLATHSGHWDKRHAVVDQLCRASESIVLNLAEGVRVRSPGQKQQFLGYAVGSALECAACLDVAVIKEFLSSELAMVEKRSLCEVVRMLVGLRRSWERSTLQEEARAYGGPPSSEPQEGYFAHEPLDVRASAYLDLCVSKAELEAGKQEPGIDLLSRITLMLKALSGGFSE